MEVLLQLLRELYGDTPTETQAALITLVERWSARTDDGAEPLTDDELAEIRTGLRALADDETVSYELLEAAADVVDEIRAEQTSRSEAAEAEQARIDAARARLDTDDAPADTSTEPEETDDTDGDDGDTEETDDTEDALDEPPVPVVAAGSLRPPRARRSDVPRARDAAPPARQGAVAVTWADAAPGVGIGSPVAGGFAQIDEAMLRRQELFRHSGGGTVKGREYLPIVQFSLDYPRERMLTGDPQRDGQIMDEAIRPFRTQTAVTAAGGFCAPLPVDYSVRTLGDARRPVRDMLPSFGTASRGGALTIVPPLLPDLAGAFTIWTEDDDIAVDPDDPGTWKPCFTVPCGTTRQTVLQALVMCLDFGVWQDRAFPEWNRGITDLSLVFYARGAEIELLRQIKALQVKPNAVDTVVSAVSDVLDALDEAATQMRSVHRLADDFPFRVVLPSTFRPIARKDFRRQLPGGSRRENLAQADEIMTAAFTELNLNVTWSPDLNMIGAQGASAELADLPPQIEASIYPEGALTLVENPDLNLGVVRDRASARMNTFMTFFEAFEVVHPLGPETGRWLTLNACPSGATVGTIDPAPLCASYT